MKTYNSDKLGQVTVPDAEAKHTPGPFYVDIRTGMAVIATQPTPQCLANRVDGEILRIVGTGFPPTGIRYPIITEEQAANVRLWAAAPELLRELERASHALGLVIETAKDKYSADEIALISGYKRLADEAITKATGGNNET